MVSLELLTKQSILRRSSAFLTPSSTSTLQRRYALRDVSSEQRPVDVLMILKKLS